MKHLLNYDFAADVIAFHKTSIDYYFLTTSLEKTTLHHFHQRQHEQRNVRTTMQNIEHALFSQKLQTLIFSHQKQLVLYDYKKNRPITSLSRHHAPISCLALDPLQAVVFAGSEDGRIYVFSMHSLRYMYMLPSHGDCISAVTVSPTLEYIASAGFERAVHIVHRANLQQVAHRFHVSEQVVAMHFIDDSTLLWVLRSGLMQRFDVTTHTITHTYEKMHDTVTAFAISDDNTIAVMGTKLGYIALYDLKTQEQVSSRYLKCNDSITALKLSGSMYYLDITVGARQWQRYKLLDAQEMIACIESASYACVDTLLRQNPLLHHHESVIALEQRFYVALHDAKAYIEQNKVHKAKALLKPFEALHMYRRIITLLFRDYEQYIKFANYIKQKRFALAYSMVLTHPELAKSKAYERMEKQFEITFEKAQQLINRDDGEAKAQQLLKPFRGIPSKVKVISELFLQKRVTDMFLRYLRNRQIVPMMVLCQQHEFLRTHHQYKQLQTYLHQIEGELFSLVEQQAYKKADAKLQEYKPFAPLIASYKALTQEVSSALAFLDTLQAGQVEQAFKILEQKPYLHRLSEAMQLEERYVQALNSALDAAFDADIARVKSLLTPFFQLKSREAEMKEVFKNGYMAQITLQTLDRNALEWGIKNYLYFFGLDEKMQQNSEENSAHSALIEKHRAKASMYITLVQLPLHITEPYDSH